MQNIEAKEYNSIRVKSDFNLTVIGAVMKKTAIIFSIITLSTLIILSTQLINTTQENPTPTPTPTSYESQTEQQIELVYAYIRTDNFTQHSASDHFPGFPQSPETTVKETRFTLVLNSTNIFPSENVPCDALFNVYLIKISSADNTLLKEGTFYLGTNFSSSFRHDLIPMSLFETIDSYGFNKMSTPYGYHIMDWSIANPNPNPKFVLPLGILDNFEETSFVSICVQKLGWILYDGITPTKCISPNSEEVISQVTLEKSEDCYLYNDLVSDEALSQIDPFKISTLLMP